VDGQYCNREGESRAGTMGGKVKRRKRAGRVLEGETDAAHLENTHWKHSLGTHTDRLSQAGTKHVRQNTPPGNCTCFTSNHTRSQKDSGSVSHLRETMMAADKTSTFLSSAHRTTLSSAPSKAFPSTNTAERDKQEGRVESHDHEVSFVLLYFACRLFSWI